MVLYLFTLVGGMGVLVFLLQMDAGIEETDLSVKYIELDLAHRITVKKRDFVNDY